MCAYMEYMEWNAGCRWCNVLCFYWNSYFGMSCTFNTQNIRFPSEDSQYIHIMHSAHMVIMICLLWSIQHTFYLGQTTGRKVTDISSHYSAVTCSWLVSEFTLTDNAYHSHTMICLYVFNRHIITIYVLPVNANIH